MLSLCPVPSTNVYQYQAGIAPGQNTELSLENMQQLLKLRPDGYVALISDAGDVGMVMEYFAALGVPAVSA